MPTGALTISSMTTAEEAEAFRRLSEAWISELFTIEDQDRATMDDPFAAITARGGDVLVARADDRIIGVVSLVPVGDGVFELSKMTVDAAERGRGAGRALMEAVIVRARELGGTSLFLGSNRRLTAAVALYESVGFRHVAPDEVGPLAYTRADVFMSLML